LTPPREGGGGDGDGGSGDGDGGGGDGDGGRMPYHGTCVEMRKMGEKNVRGEPWRGRHGVWA
jgi:hypothetical protein